MSDGSGSSHQLSDLLAEVMQYPSRIDQYLQEAIRPHELLAVAGIHKKQENVAWVALHEATGILSEEIPHLQRLLSETQSLQSLQETLKNLRSKVAAKGFLDSPEGVDADQYSEHLQKIEAGHFSSSSQGSRYTEVESLEELVALAYRQRGHLQGDDRELFEEFHTNPEAFGEDKRYLRVETESELGIVDARSLDPDVEIELQEGHADHKDMTVNKQKLGDTPLEASNQAVLIVGKDLPIVITTFGGKVVPPQNGEVMLENPGTAGELVAMASRMEYHGPLWVKVDQSQLEI
jgi:hypothetical protein